MKSINTSIQHNKYLPSSIYIKEKTRLKVWNPYSRDYIRNLACKIDKLKWMWPIRVLCRVQWTFCLDGGAKGRDKWSKNIRLHPLWTTIIQHKFHGNPITNNLTDMLVYGEFWPDGVARQKFKRSRKWLGIVLCGPNILRHVVLNQSVQRPGHTGCAVWPHMHFQTLLESPGRYS